MGCHLALLNACQSHTACNSETSLEVHVQNWLGSQSAASLLTAWLIIQDKHLSCLKTWVTELLLLHFLLHHKILQQVRLAGISGDVLQPSERKVNLQFACHCSGPCPVKHWLSPRTENSQKLPAKHLAGMWFMWVTQGTLLSLSKCSLTFSCSEGIIWGFPLFWTGLKGT